MSAPAEAAPVQGDARAAQVRTIFNEIAPRYDLLNRLMSGGVDRAWRRRAVDALEAQRDPSAPYLDACAGTYDLALELADRSAFQGRVVASDFALPMLERGRGKLGGSAVDPVCGDSLRLPFRDASFAGATVGFGVRNLADLGQGLRELARVVRPGGRVVILECAIPPNPVIRGAFLLYFTRLLPVAGRLISGHPWAYSYLPASVREFPAPDRLAGMMEDAGLEDVSYALLTGGVAALHWGRVPPSP